MHAGQLLGDGVLRPVLLLRQALDPPDLGEELADLLGNIPAILLGHDLCGSVFLMALHSFSIKMRSACAPRRAAGPFSAAPALYLSAHDCSSANSHPFNCPRQLVPSL